MASRKSTWVFGLIASATMTGCASTPSGVLPAGEDAYRVSVVGARYETQTDANLKALVERLAKIAVMDAAFCRDWRNRRIAHRDLGLALNASAKPLADASVKHVDASLNAIVAVMNAGDGHYCDSETRYDLGRPHRGAISLLYVLDDGIKAREAREDKLKSGNFDPTDHQAKDL